MKMAMAFLGKNRHYKWNSITYWHLIETGKVCGLSQKNIDNLLDKVLQSAASSIDEVSAMLPVDVG